MEVLFVAMGGLIGLVVGPVAQYVLERRREWRIRRDDRDRHTRKMVEELASTHLEILNRIQTRTLLELKVGDYSRSFRNRRLTARVPPGALRLAIETYESAVTELLNTGQDHERKLKNALASETGPVDLQPAVDRLEAAETRLAEALESAGLPDL